jgi:anti-sigma28 factor (negative regulator of flagellin synthesis)
MGAVRSKGDAAPSAYRVSAVGGAQTTDEISVSSAAQVAAAHEKLATAAREEIKKIPSVRASLVESIQSQFNSSSYRPNPEAVVDRLLKEHLQPGLG